jgi:putative tricarboxylic transport membrane protein
VYSFQTDPFMLYTALAFGIVGFIFRKLDIPKAPFLFGVILGSKIEQSFRQAMTLSSGDAMVFLQSPLAATLLAMAVAMLAFAIWSGRREAARKRRPTPVAAIGAAARTGQEFLQMTAGSIHPSKPGE